MKKNKKRVFFVIILLIISIVGSILLVKNNLTLMNNLKIIGDLWNKDETLPDNKDESVSENSINYAAETNYKGSSLIPELYEIPFKKTDRYIPNKDLDITDSKRKKIQKIAKDYAESNYNLGYRSLMANSEVFANNYKESHNTKTVFIEDNNSKNEISVEGSANKIIEWVIETHTTIESEFITEDSLLYQDGYDYYYIRGQLSSTIYSTDDIEKAAKYLEIDNPIIGKEYKQVMEICILKDFSAIKDINDAESHYKIKSCDILKK